MKRELAQMVTTYGLPSVLIALSSVCVDHAVQALIDQHIPAAEAQKWRDVSAVLMRTATGQ